MGPVPHCPHHPSQASYDIVDHSYCKVWIRKFDRLHLFEEYPLIIQN